MFNLGQLIAMMAGVPVGVGWASPPGRQKYSQAKRRRNARRGWAGYCPPSGGKVLWPASRGAYVKKLHDPL